MSTFLTDPRALNVELIQLKGNDTFDFNCMKCTNCCRGHLKELKETNIFLSGPDVQRIVRFLDDTLESVIKKCTTIYQDPSLGLSVCMLKSRYDGTCAFMKKGLCSIYEARPRTCALYPLTQEIKFSIRKGQVSYENEAFYYKRPGWGYKCKSDHSYTLSEWLNDNHIPTPDIEEIEWKKEMLRLSNEIRRSKMKTDYSIDTLLKLYKFKTASL